MALMVTSAPMWLPHRHRHGPSGARL